MIDALCRDCGAVWVAPVILGLTKCHECGSENTCVATFEEAKAEMDRDFNMPSGKP